VSSGELIFLDNDSLPDKYDKLVQEGQLTAQTTDRGVKLVPIGPGVSVETLQGREVALKQFETRLRALKKIV